MPFASASFQALTCVFLFHELPRDARQNVLNECFRLLEPGGTLVLADSIQIEDSPKFTPIMENFHKIFHEPYYRDYIVDNINLRLEESGFDVDQCMRDEIFIYRSYRCKVCFSGHQSDTYIRD